MSERDPSHRGLEAPHQSFKNSPHSAITDYFLYVGRPALEDMDAAGAVLTARYRERDGARAAHSICRDLAMRIHDPTTILAAMFSADHEAIPGRWKADHETTRTILSMVAHLEIGDLHAQQLIPVGDGEFPGLAERLAEVEQFLGALQER
jgi:hypothetical protein